MTLKEAARTLAAAGIEDAAWEARCLAAAATGRSPASLLAAQNEELSSPALDGMLRRRAAREPLQYILGTWDFMGLTFAVSPDCLIPRPDTETLVEAALRLLPPRARVADLCTGSGCIGISIAHALPGAAVTAVEIARPAARMAEENARRLGVSERFSVLLGDVTRVVFPAGTSFDAVVANPPYIALDEMKALAPELSYEPRGALTDGGDGLSVIRGVVRTAAAVLPPDGFLLMEFGASQGAAVAQIARDGGFSAEILRDAGGRDRVLYARPLSDKN